MRRAAGAARAVDPGDRPSRHASAHPVRSTFRGFWASAGDADAFRRHLAGTFLAQARAASRLSLDAGKAPAYRSAGGCSRGACANRVSALGRGRRHQSLEFSDHADIRAAGGDSRGGQPMPDQAFRAHSHGQRTARAPDRGVFRPVGGVRGDRRARSGRGVLSAAGA
jgi:hypothetical protein